MCTILAIIISDNSLAQKPNLVDESSCSTLVADPAVPVVCGVCIFIVVLAIACVNWMYG